PIDEPSARARKRSAQRHRRSTNEYHQCMACGAPADPSFGLAEDSWCPSCHRAGEVVSMQGQWPSPQLYGQWVMKREREAEAQRTQAELDEFLQRHAKGEEKTPAMKSKKSHTGTYHCPHCFIEFDLVAERS